MVKKFIFSVYAGLIVFSCFSFAGFYGPLELGMSSSQAQHVLSTFPGVNPPVASNAFGAVKEFGSHFTTAKPYGAAECILRLGYANDKLNALTLQSREIFEPSDYDGKLKSRYKTFAMMHEAMFGKPLGVVKWPSISGFREGEMRPIHIYRMPQDMLAMVGVARYGGGDFAVAVRFASENYLRGKPLTVREETVSEWNKVKEFDELKEADQWILKATKALSLKKAKDALECFSKASNLGSARGFWGMALMYSGGKGIEADKEMAEDCRMKASRLGFAMSAVEVDRNFNEAMKKSGLNSSDVKVLLFELHRAADENVISAQYNLGVMYKNGYGVSQDMAKAKKYLQAANNAGDKQAATMLSTME